MKFSMYVIEHWLRKFPSVSIIKSSEPTILGVKLFSYEKDPDPDYLYIGHNNDFFYGSESRDVLLVHRKDVISLATVELEDVFNEVIECISFYNRWEQKMLGAYNSANPEQEIIDQCAGIFGPMFFTTMSLQITAISQQYPKGSINLNWDDFLETGTLSLERFSVMKDGNFMLNHNKIWDCGIFFEDNVEKYNHSIMISQVNMSGKLTGQLTIISEDPFQHYQMDLIPPLKKALCLVSNTLTEGDRSTIANSVFLDLVNGNKKELVIQKFNDLMGWNNRRRCVVSVLKHPNSLIVTFGYDVNILRQSFPEALFCVNEDTAQENEIICWIPLPEQYEKAPQNYSEKTTLKRYRESFGSFGFEYGVSYPLYGVENLDIQYLQARAAIKKGVTQFYQCAMMELIGFSDNIAYRKAAVHPAIDKILLYDKEKNTTYFQMLEVFLHNERDRVKTAEELYIHKNTLVYRLKKMEQLFEINLDETYEREYLLHSVNCVRTLQ